MELFSGAGEQPLPSCLVHSSATGSLEKAFVPWGWCPLCPILKLYLLCQGELSGNGGGNGI